MTGKIYPNIDVIRQIVLALPSTQESTLHGYPSFKAFKKLLACPAIHKSAEPDSLLVKMDADERARLISKEPGKYYITDHYLKNPVLLVRLSKVDRKSLQVLLEKSWHFLSQDSRIGSAENPKKYRRMPARS